MATSDVDIINRALRKVDNTVIQSLTETTETGLSVRDVYDESRQYLLACAGWTFALKRQKLARLSETPAFGYSYYYQRPAGMIRPVGMFIDSVGRAKLRDFKIEMPGIAASAEDIYARFIFDLTDPNKFSPLFRAALEDLLAHKFAYDLPGSRALAQDHLDRFERVSLPRAYSNDAIDDGEDDFGPDSDWVTARYSGSDRDGW